MRSVPPALALLAVATTARAARAQSSAPPPLLSYEAPASCAAEAEFTRRFMARLDASSSAEVGARRLRVRIVRADGQFVGRLSVVEPDGRSTTKTLSGTDCEGLVQALALVAALAVRSDGTDEEPKTKVDAEKLGVGNDASVPAPEPTKPVDATPAAPSKEVETAERLRQTKASARWGVHAGNLVSAGPAPGPLFSAIAGLHWTLDCASPCGIALGLSLTGGATLPLSETGGTASFTWWGARMTACGIRIDVGHILRIRGCLLGDVGYVNARGSDTVAPASSSRGWLSLGAASQVELPLSPRVAIQLTGGAEAPLRRDRYAFGADDFYQVPPLTVTGSVTLAAYFAP